MTLIILLWLIISHILYGCTVLYNTNKFLDESHDFNKELIEAYITSLFWPLSLCDYIFILVKNIIFIIVGIFIFSFEFISKLYSKICVMYWDLSIFFFSNF